MILTNNKQHFKMILAVLVGTLVFKGSLKAQQSSDVTPKLFLPGKVSTKYSERDMTISPDGKLAYFTLQTYQFERQVIMYMTRQDDEWSDPVVAPFSGLYKDIEPTFSPDGQRLYFSSKRPLEGTEQKEDFDIWFIEKEGNDSWFEPQHIGNIINTEANEFYPSVVNDGSIYFTSSYDNSKGYEDIYYSKWNGSSFETPVSLDSMINSKVYEFNAHVAPDESYMFFTSYGRKEGAGGGDLYISFGDGKGNWSKALNLGNIVNSPGLDYCPSVSPDGQYFYFTSNKNNYNELPRIKNRNEIQAAMDGLYNGYDNVYQIPFESLMNYIKSMSENN